MIRSQILPMHTTFFGEQLLWGSGIFLCIILSLLSTDSLREEWLLEMVHL